METFLLPIAVPGFHEVSVPLRGNGSWKPLERYIAIGYLKKVSVPLRGNGSWKLQNYLVDLVKSRVSVPLRGNGSWKQGMTQDVSPAMKRFSPLAG